MAENAPATPSKTGALRTLGRGWMRAGEVAAHGLGLVIFTLLFIFAFGPYAIACKLAGKRFLPRYTGNETSFYLPREVVEPTLEWAKKQG